MDLLTKTMACTMASAVTAHHLEAFPRNALYCGRGMPHMKNYKTVKEVCALTGLTGKHLYYFHHEKVVRATAFSNYSVVGNDGYKLYDDAAVEKLQQIALYYELGLKRNEIKEIMLRPDYDSNAVLDDLLALQLEKRAHIDRLIVAIEHLKMFGTKNGAVAIIKDMSLDELGQKIQGFSTSNLDRYISGILNSTDNYDTILSQQMRSLCSLDTEDMFGNQGKAIISEIFRTAADLYGVIGYLMIHGVFLSGIGYGAIIQNVVGPISEETASNCGKAAMKYVESQIRQFLKEIEIILQNHKAVIGLPFDSPALTGLIDDVKHLFQSFFGFRTEADYQLILGSLNIVRDGEKQTNLYYILNAIKHRCSVAD